MACDPAACHIHLRSPLPVSEYGYMATDREKREEEAKGGEEEENERNSMCSALTARSSTGRRGPVHTGLDAGGKKKLGEEKGKEGSTSLTAPFDGSF